MRPALRLPHRLLLTLASAGLLAALSACSSAPKEEPVAGPPARESAVLEEVREALTSIGVRGMMVTEIKGFGSQSGHTEIYRGAEYAVNFGPKVNIEIAVSASMADQVVETIVNTAKTDKIGDGKIFVLDLAQAVRVRTGETNEDAL